MAVIQRRVRHASRQGACTAHVDATPAACPARITLARVTDAVESWTRLPAANLTGHASAANPRHRAPPRSLRPRGLCGSRLCRCHPPPAFAAATCRGHAPLRAPVRSRPLQPPSACGGGPLLLGALAPAAAAPSPDVAAACDVPGASSIPAPSVRGMKGVRQRLVGGLQLRRPPPLSRG